MSFLAANEQVADGEALGVYSPGGVSQGVSVSSRWTPDTVRPTLLSFSVSREHQHMLTLTFDEPMNVSSLRIPELAFQNSIPTPTHVYNIIFRAELFRVSEALTRFEIQVCV